MDEAMRAGHPETAELQAHADGELRDERVVMHVESCAACGEEVAAIRRVTAALALGSKPPDSLAARIQAQRAGVADAPHRAASRPRSRVRAFAMPVGLAAAAGLLVFAPRAFRDDPRVERPAPAGAKGALPGAGFETLLPEWDRGSVDSVVRAARGRAMKVELRYAAGFKESGRAELLAHRIRRYLVDQGTGSAMIEVLREETRHSTRPIPAGAVHITVRSR